MKKMQPATQLFLRLALGISYLVPALDRLGAWGKPGEKHISWGDWSHFMQYAYQVMSFLPRIIVPAFAAVATAAEIITGVLLIAGKWTKAAAFSSGWLALSFALSMTISFGIVSPLSYSVFTVSAASFLLATLDKYPWSMDNTYLSK